MDKIFAFIVLVLTWHMYVDDSVTKGPQNNQFFFAAKAAFSQK